MKVVSVWFLFVVVPALTLVTWWLRARRGPSRNRRHGGAGGLAAALRRLWCGAVRLGVRPSKGCRSTPEGWSDPAAVRAAEPPARSRPPADGGSSAKADFRRNAAGHRLPRMPHDLQRVACPTVRVPQY